jgi:hypothetical protein
MYLNNVEVTNQLFVDGHHGACVVELPTVVGSRKDGDQLALREELITVLHHLNKARTQILFNVETLQIDTGHVHDDVCPSAVFH